MFAELESGQLLDPLGSPVPEDVSGEFAGVVQEPYIHHSGVVDVRSRVMRHVTGWDKTSDLAPFHLVVHISELHDRGCLLRQSNCE